MKLLINIKENWYYLVFKEPVWFLSESMENSGIEPLTPCLQSRCSSIWANSPYMGLNGLEPSTSRLSGVRSNQLSYRPKKRVTRIELATTAWKAVVLPLNYTRRIQIWRGTESNRRHMELQSIALPTELPSHLNGPYETRTRDLLRDREAS